MHGSMLRLRELLLPDLASFELLLAEPGPWLGAFHFPFGMPRAFVQAVQLGDRLDAVLCLAQVTCASGQPRLGLPEHVDSLEGCIVGG